MSQFSPDPHARFQMAVAFLGGPAAAATYLDISPRTLRRLLAKESPLKPGFFADITTALREHALFCNQLADTFAADWLEGGAHGDD